MTDATTTAAPPAPADGVIGTLNFLRPGSPRPVTYRHQPPEGVPWISGEYEPVHVAIRNGRPAADRGKLSLDRCGFELIRQASALSDFSDPAQIRAVYHPESAAIIRAATGASDVLVFDHTLRDSLQGAPTTNALREPVRRVHNDQTPDSAERRIRDQLPADEADRWLDRRHAIINLWRPLSTVEQLPLAMCDARTIAPADLVLATLIYENRVGESYHFHHNPAQGWYYFPRLGPDECLLLKIFDSRTDVARMTAHTAFDDPTTAPDAAPRRSIELRAIAFW